MKIVEKISIVVMIDQLKIEIFDHFEINLLRLQTQICDQHRIIALIAYFYLIKIAKIEITKSFFTIDFLFTSIL